jgi:hypothetical protein
MKVEKPFTDLWIDTRLTEEEMNFLWDACSGPEPKTNWKGNLVGNISRSELIEDKDNWFYETVLKKLIEKMFYDDWDNYRKYHIVKEEPLPEFKLGTLWVNYMKQHEFNPLPHFHTGFFSFAIFMKIPIHWKEQHALSISANSAAPSASDFQFVWTEKDSDVVQTRNIKLCPEDEGRMLFFPASLQHQVYPFYECEEERITISGNIVFVDPNKPQMQKMSSDVYEEKEKILKIMEESVKIMKEDLKQ